MNVLLVQAQVLVCCHAHLPKVIAVVQRMAKQLRDQYHLNNFHPISPWRFTHLLLM